MPTYEVTPPNRFTPITVEADRVDIDPEGIVFVNASQDGRERVPILAFSSASRCEQIEP